MDQLAQLLGRQAQPLDLLSHGRRDVQAEGVLRDAVERRHAGQRPRVQLGVPLGLDRPLEYLAQDGAAVLGLALQEGAPARQLLAHLPLLDDRVEVARRALLGVEAGDLFGHLLPAWSRSAMAAQDDVGALTSGDGGREVRQLAVEARQLGDERRLLRGQDLYLGALLHQRVDGLLQRGRRHDVVEEHPRDPFVGFGGAQ